MKILGFKYAIWRLIYCGLMWHIKNDQIKQIAGLKVETMSDQPIETRKVGRPEKYKPEYCELVLELMKNGESIAACCAEIGVPRQTLMEWQNRHKEFRDACEQGKEESQRWWENEAMASARGVAPKNANPKMIQFIMSRRFPDYYTKVNTESKVTATVKTVVFETQLTNGTIRQSGNFEQIVEETNVNALIDEVTDEAWKAPNESD